jgi:hypothetical protein
MDEKTPRRVLGREKGGVDSLANLEENTERPTSSAEPSQFDVGRWALSVGRYGFARNSN